VNANRQIMARSGPDKPVVSLERERENAVELLTHHFAQDDLSLEELEQRMERVYRATSVQALRDLTRDLPSEEKPTAPERRPAPVPAAFAPRQERIASFMGSTKRRGPWQVAPELKVVSVMSETHLDLTEAHFGPGVTEIKLRSLMAQVTIVLPPGVRVVFQPSTFMSEASDESDNPPPVGSGAPVIRITGPVVMTGLKVSVRTRERSLSGSADEDL
jgi:hypothetical protein